ncbi:MAG: polysaccharide export protein [Phormidesmis sp. RL_2_1]|nr:polysaccharide export protein [Phormidesmis sp. RL_2_1]
MLAIAQNLPNLSAPPVDGPTLMPDQPIEPPREQIIPPPPTTDISASSYLLGPGDQIQVSVYGFEEYTGPLLILPDGTISLPLIGQVFAAGRTTAQLTRELTVALDRILVSPSVSVTLNSLRPVVVNVSGEVYRPGPTQLQTNTTATETSSSAASAPSVSSAIVQAGGVTRTANVREIVVLRALPNGNTIRKTVNLWDSLGSETLPEDMLLRDGDLVFVPQLAAADLGDGRLLSRSSLAPNTVRVRVVGEVTRPGEVPVPPNSSLSSAVAIAGGPTDDARLNDVAFIRMNDSGEVTQEVVNLSNLVDNYQVQDGDVIIVPKTNTGSVLDFAQRLLSPLGFLFRFFD